MNKSLLLILLSFVSLMSLGQSVTPEDRFRKLTAQIELNIWDKDNSDEKLKIEKIIYDEIPKYIDFRGTVVECLKWTDKLGENLLIQSVSGHFPWKEYDEDSIDYMMQDKWELYAYLFRKNTDEKTYKRVWKVYDYTECFGVDWYAGFIPHATTITDVDNNGISEISMPYISICRGGMDPGDMKIIAYEGDVKYAVRGRTMLLCKEGYPDGGDYTLSKNLENKDLLKRFLIKRWDDHKCEDERFY